ALVGSDPRQLRLRVDNALEVRPERAVLVRAGADGEEHAIAPRRLFFGEEAERLREYDGVGDRRRGSLRWRLRARRQDRARRGRAIELVVVVLGANAGLQTEGIPQLPGRVAANARREVARVGTAVGGEAKPVGSEIGALLQSAQVVADAVGQVETH